MAAQLRLPALRPLLFGGGLCCVLAVGGLAWLHAPFGGAASEADVASDAAHAADPWADIDRFQPGEIIASSGERRAIVSALLRSSHDQPLLPLRPDFEVPLDSATALLDQRYFDPTGGGVPLEWIGHETDRWITPGFRLADFVARDGAPMVRVSPTLVNGLERLRRLAGEIVVISGYRHPAHNALVGGAGDSYHQAGKAADIYSPEVSTVELALMALESMGCGIGLGLGATSLHVDIRGELATWTYRGAPITAAAFATLARTQCGLPVSQALVSRAEDAWLSEPAADPTEAWGTAPSARPGGEGLLGRYQDRLLETAAQAYGRLGAGAVVVDRRSSASSREPYYLPAGHPAIDEFGVGNLVEFCLSRTEAGYFAYVILSDFESPLTGVMSLGAMPGQSTPPGRPATPAPAVQRETASTGQDDGYESGHWVIVVGSTLDEAAARQLRDSHEARLQPRGRAAQIIEGDGRYRVVVGPFESQSAASTALRLLRDVVPQDAWLMSL